MTTVLAATLLLAQTLAIAHAVSHLGQPTDRPLAPGHSLPYCSECGSLAGLQSAPAGAGLLHLVLDETAEASIETADGPVPAARTIHAYRSRAPPA